MSARNMFFGGFGIKIDILNKGALFAFRQLTGAALATSYAVNEVISTFIKFETAMADLSRLVVISTGDVEGLGETMTGLGNSILKMSNESVYSFNEIADALGYLMRAGYTSTSAIDQLSQSILLATAVGMELNDATRTMVRLQNMFSYAGQDVKNVADALTKSEQLFAMTTEDMNTALSMVGATAAEAGLSLGQLSAAIGILYSAGINASTAGTILRKAISSVLDITPGTEEAITSLGINMDYFSSLIPLDRLRLLAQYILAIEDPSQRLAVAFDIFGVRGVNILPVLEALNGDFDQLASSIDNASGVAEQAATVFEETLYGKLVMLEQSLENLIVKIGEYSFSSIPQAITITGLFSTAVYSLTTAKNLLITTSIREINITGILNALKTYSMRLSIMSTIANIREKLSVFWVVVAKILLGKVSIRNIKIRIKEGIVSTLTTIKNFILASSYGVLTVTIKIATVATKTFMKALGPIGLALTILGSIIYAVKDQFGGFSGVMEGLKAIMKPFIDLFKMLADVINVFAQALAPITGFFLKYLVFWIKMALAPFRMLAIVFKFLLIPVKFFGKVLGTIINNIKEAIVSSGLWQKAMELLGQVMNFVWKVVAGVFNLFIKLVNLIIRFLKKVGLLKDDVQEIQEMTAEEAKAEFEGTTETEEDKGGTGTDNEEINTGDYGGEGSTLPPAGTSEFPTPTSTTTTGSTGGTSGGGMGEGAVNVYIYITPEFDEMMDSEGFGETVGKTVALEIKRTRGSYI